MQVDSHRRTVMNRINHRRLIVGLFFYVAGLLSIPSPVHAEDTDIFSLNSAISGQRPSVLIILDSSANWSSTDTIAGGSKYTHVSAALASTISNLTDQFHVGLMMYSETARGNDNIDGGTMRAGVRQMTAANRTMLVNFFNSVDGGFDKSNNTAMGMAFYEAYLYFKSANAYSGFGKVKRDYHLNTCPTSGSQAGAPIAMQNANNTLWASSGNALSTSSSAAYNGPITDACQKNFIIYIANGNVTDPNSSNADATSFLAAAGGDTSPVPMNQNDGNQGNISDEWTRFLASADISGLAGKQTVVTYTVEV